MTRILILFAHPRFEKSRANRALLDGVKGLPGVTLHDLYEEYPDFNIDTDREKALLIQHDALVWHHPFYMYGAPAILKQWIDLVLEYGWAYGKDGDNLKDTITFNAVTAGGTRDAYTAGGHNGFTVREFLCPFEQTARLCKMTYLPPFLVHGTHLLSDSDMKKQGQTYRRLLERISKDELNVDAAQNYEYLNDWLASVTEVSP